MNEKLSLENVFGATDERMIDTIRPATKGRKLPRWLLIPVVLSLLVAALRFQGGMKVLAGIEPFLLGLGALCAGLFSGRVEENTFQRLRRRRTIMKTLVWLVFIAAAITSAAFLLRYLGKHWSGVQERAAWIALASVVWFGSAAVGTLIILVLDGAVRLIVTDFRRRIILGVLSLIMLAFVASGFVVNAVASWGTTTDFPMVFGFDLGRLPFAAEAAGRPGGFTLAAFIGGAVVALPAIVSVCAKLADTVMERLIPLQRAFERVAEGDREVHVEEAGSPEFWSLALSFNEMVDRLYLAERIERAFGQYVSAQVLEQIRSQQGNVRMPAQARTATVFFADIRGFTPISEKLPPNVVVDLLNRYLEQVVPIVEGHRGFLNKFIGDAVVVVFNAPIDQPDHAERAVNCAIALQKLVSQLNAHGFFPEVGELHIGIGIATGPMVCSNIGTKTRLEYTVIGDTVNIASRMTGHARAGEVWVSEATAVRLNKNQQAFPGEPIKFKGKDRAIVPYKVWPSDA